MADAQIAIIDGDQTQVVLAPGENPAIVASIPGPQGPAGAVAAAIDGSAALPSIAFASDTDTGLYRVGANQLGVSTGGTQRLVIDSNGQIEATSLGTAASPTWTFVGDPNTGIYSPGADQLALSTNGTGRLFVYSDGSIDLGNTSQATLPTVKASTNPRLNFSDGTNSSYVGLVGVDNRLINFATTGTTLVQSNANVILRVVGSDFIRFDTANTERLRITSTGQLSHIGAGSSGSPAVSFSGSAASNSLVVDSNSRVGVGTSSPSRPLHVIGSAVFDDGTTQATIWPNLGSNDAGFGTNTNHPVSIVTNGSRRLNITAAGLVGIGTSTPWSTLTVGSGGTANPAADATIHASSIDQYRLKLTSVNFNADTKWLGLGFGYSDNYMKVGILAEAKDANARANLHFCLNNAASSANASLSDSRMVITSAGLVGVGNPSPSTALDVTGQITTRGSIGAVNFEPRDASGAVFSVYNGTGDDLRVFSNSADRVTITAGGLVGIGSTSPQGLLDLGAAVDATKLLLYSSGNVKYGFGIATDTLRYFAPGTSGIHSFGGISTTDGTTYSERMRLDGSGRLLVGTSSARNVGSSLTQLSYLQIESSSSTLGGGINITANRNDTLGASINLAKSRASAVGGVSILAADDEVGIIRFAGADGTDLETPAASIQAFVDGTPGANDMPGRLVFSVSQDGSASPTERLRISNDGWTNLFVTNNDGFQSRNSAAAGTSTGLFVGRHSATNTANGTISYAVYTNGNVVNTNGSYTALSDAKLKENIVDAGSQWNDLKAIQIRNWNFKAETGHETHRQIGPIAQELETVCPGLVFETPDRDEDGNETGEVTKGVNQSVLYMKAVKALQEAMERIETLEAKVAALEAS